MLEILMCYLFNHKARYIRFKKNKNVGFWKCVRCGKDLEKIRKELYK